MMPWLSITCIQNFPSSLVFILEIDNYLKHTEIALFRQYITKIVLPVGQIYFLDTWWNESLICTCFCFNRLHWVTSRLGLYHIQITISNWAFDIYSFRSSHKLPQVTTCRPKLRVTGDIYTSVNQAIIGQIMACCLLSVKPLSEPM